MGKLIVARHVVPFHPLIETEWVRQIEEFGQRLVPHLPRERSQAVTLTSPKERAVVVAQHLLDQHGVRLRRQPELDVGGPSVPPQQVREVVRAAMHENQLVIAISHQPICERLAVDIWQSLGMRMIDSPSFDEYAAAVLIDPHLAPDFAWEWTYI